MHEVARHNAAQAEEVALPMKPPQSRAASTVRALDIAELVA